MSIEMAFVSPFLAPSTSSSFTSSTPLRTRHRVSSSTPATPSPRTHPSHHRARPRPRPHHHHHASPSAAPAGTTRTTATPRATATAPDPRPSVSLVSLGCPKNVTDAEVILGDLADRGIRVEPAGSPSDVTLINTCAFVEDAKRESLEAILAAAREKAATASTKGIIVTGCLAQRYADELAAELPEVDAVVGFAHYDTLADRVAEIAARDTLPSLQTQQQLTTATNSDGSTTATAAPLEGRVAVGTPNVPFRQEHRRVRLGPKHSVYVRLAEGCSHACTFCAIPGQFRGGFRSKPWDAVVSEISHLVSRGARELVFIAEDTNQYGMDFPSSESRRLSDLLRHVGASEPAARWLRILYCYPSYFTDELVAAIADVPSVCKYIDMPLQHISDPVLRRMNRPGRAHTEQLLHKLKSRIPGLVLRTTFITGFPGETEQDHRELVEFIKQERFRHAGFFVYSEEEGTPAAEFEDQTPMEVREYRRDELTAIQQGIQEEIAEEQVGKVVEVMVDRIEDGHSIGRTKYDAPEIDANVHILQEIEPGTMLNVRILGTSSFDLYGEPA